MHSLCSSKGLSMRALKQASETQDPLRTLERQLHNLKSGSELLTEGLLLVHSRKILLGYGLQFCQCCDWHRLGRQRHLLTSESVGGVLHTATRS